MKSVDATTEGPAQGRNAATGTVAQSATGLTRPVAAPSQDRTALLQPTDSAYGIMTYPLIDIIIAKVVPARSHACS